MKPFTLKWWMHMYSRIGHEGSILSAKGEHQGKRYSELYELGVWVHKRIIDKYGEQDD